MCITSYPDESIAMVILGQYQYSEICVVLVPAKRCASCLVLDRPWFESMMSHDGLRSDYSTGAKK